MTRLGLDARGSIPREDRYFRVQLVSGANLASCPVGIEYVSPGVKAT